MGRGRPGGNPDFGTKYKNKPKGTEPLSDQVLISLRPSTKLLLKILAEEKDCTVPDIVRAAIEEYLAKIQMPKSA